MLGFRPSRNATARIDNPLARKNISISRSFIAHTGYLELFDLVVKHILPGMGLFFTLCCISIVNSPHKKSTSQLLEPLSNHYEALAVETTYII